MYSCEIKFTLGLMPPFQMVPLAIFTNTFGENIFLKTNPHV